jgi:catechol 2,3-dioxygenase-like lactoylglutathione lyase family enzyme
MASAFALDHLVLVVGDIEASLDWYSRHAGLAPVNVDEWRAGNAPFPSLRVDEGTIIDFIAGRTAEEGRGHLDHVCFVVSAADLDALSRDPALTIVSSGQRSGARGIGESVYVHDPDGLLVEFRCYPADGATG